MSGECDECGYHTLECRCKENYRQAFKEFDDFWKGYAHELNTFRTDLNNRIGKKLTERDLDEIESVQHYIKYVITNPESHILELFSAIHKLETVANKFILDGYDSSEIENLLNIEDLKDLVSNFIDRVKKEFQIE